MKISSLFLPPVAKELSKLGDGTGDCCNISHIVSQFLSFWFHAQISSTMVKDVTMFDFCSCVGWSLCWVNVACPCLTCVLTSLRFNIRIVRFSYVISPHGSTDDLKTKQKTLKCWDLAFNDFWKYVSAVHSRKRNILYIISYSLALNHGVVIGLANHIKGVHMIWVTYFKV